MTGIELIAAERKRQIEAEGWSIAHDSEFHQYGELAMAGACYALNDHLYPLGQTTENKFGVHMTIERKTFWPFAKKWWKPALTTNPGDRIKELTKAGALIAAEIDRLNNIPVTN
jgi:hypothetical protein